jgi:hypothetical protein
MPAMQHLTIGAVRDSGGEVGIKLCRSLLLYLFHLQTKNGAMQMVAEQVKFKPRAYDGTRAWAPCPSRTSAHSVCRPAAYFPSQGPTETLFTAFVLDGRGTVLMHTCVYVRSLSTGPSTQGCKAL